MFDRSLLQILRLYQEVKDSDEIFDSRRIFLAVFSNCSCNLSENLKQCYAFNDDCLCNSKRGTIRSTSETSGTDFDYLG